MAEEAKAMENFLNNVLNKGKIVKNISWVLGIVPLCDMRDVALGYVIGETMHRHSLFIELDGREPTTEDFEKLQKIFREKLPKIVKKIESELGE